VSLIRDETSLEKGNIVISGYVIGTEVKWNEDNTLTTGVIKDVYRSSAEITIDGQTRLIEVSDDVPTYLIEDHDGNILILAHTDVTLKSSNLHT